MGSIILPKGYHPDFSAPDKKPSGLVEIDWSNPITRSLEYLLLPGDSWNNYSKGDQPIVLLPDGIWERGVNQWGSYLYRTTNNNTGLKYTSSRISGNVPRSLFVVATPTISNDSGAFVVMGETGLGKGWICKRSGGALRTDISFGSYTSSLSPVVGEVNYFGYTSKGVNLNDNILYLNGESEQSTTDRAMNTTASAVEFFGGTLEGNHNGVRDRVHMVVLFSRELTPEEMQSLTRDPYQLLKPSESSRVWFEPSLNRIFLPPKEYLPGFTSPQRKPSGSVELDRSNPLAKGLTLFSIFNSEGPGVYDAAAGKTYWDATHGLTQSNFTVAADGYGRKVNVAGSPSGQQRLRLTGDRDNLDEGYRTVLTGAVYTDAGADHTVLHHGTLVGSTEHILLWADTNGGQLRPAINAGSSYYGSEGGIPANEFVIWGAGYVVTSGAAAAQHWVNGKKSGSSNPDIGDTRFALVQPLNFANQESGGRQHKGSVYFYAIWDRELSEAEHKSFAEDPYQLLKPVETPVYMIAAGGASGVFSDSTLQWDLVSAVSNDADLRWNLLNAISQDSGLQWSILNAALQDGTLQWDIVSSVLQDADLRWDVQSAASSFLRPNQQVTLGGWTDQAAGTTDIWQSIDEASVDTADYIASASNPAGGDYYEFGLTDPNADLDEAQPATIRFNIARSGGRTAFGTLQLYQGATKVAEILDASATDTPTEYTHTLSAGEKALITNLNALTMRVDARVTGGGAATQIRVHWAEFECYLGEALSQVNSDSDLRWNILSAAISDSDLRWNILSAVMSDSDTRWDVLNSALKDSDIRWNILQAVSQDPTIQWSILSSAVSDSNLRWDILSAIQSDSDLQWAVLNAVAQDSELRWDVLQAILQDTDLRWDIQSALSAVSNDATLQWDVVMGLSSDSDIRWGILQSALSDKDLRWSIVNAVQGSTDLRWSVLEAISSDSDLRWDLLQIILSDTALQWDVLQASLADLDLRWDIAAALGTAQQDLSLQWSVLSAVYASLTSQWDLFNAVTADSELKWSILNTLAKDLTSRWDVRAAIESGATIQWAILSSSESELALQWHIQSLTQFPDLEGTITLRSNTPLFALDSNTPIVTLKD